MQDQTMLQYQRREFNITLLLYISNSASMQVGSYQKLSLYSNTFSEL